VNWKRELTILLLLLGTGLLLLPIAVYFVGQKVIGEYAPGRDAIDLVAAVWADLAGMRPAAWLLTASPYLVLQLLRLARHEWRRRGRAADRQQGPKSRRISSPT
jgi:hypothetical protein